MSDVKIPGVGPVKKQYAIGGVAIVVVIVGYSYMKRSKANAAAAAATPVDTSTATPADPNGIASMSSDASGYNTVYPSAYPQQSQYGYDLYGNPLPAPTGLGSGGVYTTNSDWATAADDLLQNTGITLQVASLAVSRVLGGLSVTSTQQGYFLQAVGQLGQPPQGYHTPILVVDTPTPTHSGTPNKPSGLHAQRVDRTGISVAWSAVSGSRGYAIFLDGHRKTSVVYTSDYLPDLKPHTTHTIGVAAIGDGGVLSPQTSIHVTTHK